MMRDCNISINQLADFSQGTEAKKRSIIKQQKTPNSFKVAYYQLAKSRIKKSIANKGDIKPILAGIEELKNKTVVKERQITDRIVSLDALQRFIGLKIPVLLKNYDYTVLKKVETKSLMIKGVEVIISPELIIEIEIEKKKFLGAVKLHISKGNIFDRQQQLYISSAIQKYLEKNVVKNGEIVLPELCLSIDIFGEGIISAPVNVDDRIKDIEIICEEVKRMWDAA